MLIVKRLYLLLFLLIYSNIPCTTGFSLKDFLHSLASYLPTMLRKTNTKIYISGVNDDKFHKYNLNNNALYSHVQKKYKPNADMPLEDKVKYRITTVKMVDNINSEEYIRGGELYLRRSSMKCTKQVPLYQKLDACITDTEIAFQSSWSRLHESYVDLRSNITRLRMVSRHCVKRNVWIPKSENLRTNKKYKKCLEKGKNAMADEGLSSKDTFRKLLRETPVDGIYKDGMNCSKEVFADRRYTWRPARRMNVVRKNKGKKKKGNNNKGNNNKGKNNKPKKSPFENEDSQYEYYDHHVDRLYDGYKFSLIDEHFHNEIEEKFSGEVDEDLKSEEIIYKDPNVVAGTVQDPDTANITIIDELNNVCNITVDGKLCIQGEIGGGRFEDDKSYMPRKVHACIREVEANLDNMWSILLKDHKAIEKNLAATKTLARQCKSRYSWSTRCSNQKTVRSFQICYKRGLRSIARYGISSKNRLKKDLKAVHDTVDVLWERAKVCWKKALEIVRCRTTTVKIVTTTPFDYEDGDEKKLVLEPDTSYEHVDRL